MNSIHSKKQHIYYIDFLKFIGLVLIIFAHINAPGWALAIRTFDVPLMVIVSSFLASKSYAKYENQGKFPIQYLIHRIKRLAVPTWIFLLLYFSLHFLFTKELFSLKYYISSFCLTRYGIGYVWVILIYIYSAILIPLFNKFKLSSKFIISILAIYILYETTCFLKLGENNILIDTIFYYIIPYGCLTFLGYNYDSFSKKVIHILLITSFALFIILAFIMWYIHGSPQSPSIAKYPPQLYYLSYGIFVSFLLLQFCKRYNLKIYKSKLVNYISRHSLWIYLWHIITLKLYKILNLPQIWYIEFVIILVSSLFITFVVNKLLDLIEKKRKYTFLSYLRG
ncbi:MAG: acyltransferase [Clostridia bacterium]|nr:acyltransferase [Clostridia bacterium]